MGTSTRCSGTTLIPAQPPWKPLPLRARILLRSLGATNSEHSKENRMYLRATSPLLSLNPSVRGGDWRSQMVWLRVGCRLVAVWSGCSLVWVGCSLVWLQFGLGSLQFGLVAEEDLQAHKSSLR